MPVFGLSLFWILPFPAALTFYIIILIISILLYYAIMKSMMLPVKTDSQGLIGQEGYVTSIADNYNIIKVHGELWKAESKEKLTVGTYVKISGIQGLVLNVSNNL